jgi:hypothetical protein
MALAARQKAKDASATRTRVGTSVIVREKTIASTTRPFFVHCGTRIARIAAAICVKRVRRTCAGGPLGLGGSAGRGAGEATATIVLGPFIVSTCQYGTGEAPGTGKSALSFPDKAGGLAPENDALPG